MSAWLQAFREMRWWLVVSVWAGALLLCGLAVLWLQIPDSHVWQFAFSVVSACVLMALLLCFFCFLCSRALGTSVMERWWLRWLLLAAVVVVWWLLQIPINKLVEHRELYAGYWTSKLPQSLRGAHTYEHLLWLQESVISFVRLLIAGLLLPVVVSFGAGEWSRSLPQAASTWKRWWYWAAVIVCGWAAAAVADKLVDWTPSHGLARELLSVTLRLGAVFTLDVLLACFLLQLIVVAFRKVEITAGS